MKTLVDQLAQYADYHRDRRNIATHFVGIPMIVLAVQVLLSRPALQAGALVLTPALLTTLLACLYYVALDRPLGVVGRAHREPLRLRRPARRHRPHHPARLARRQVARP